MDPDLHVDADIATAHTLPSAVYFEPELYRRALERVFVPSWQPAGEVGRLKAPGHVVPFTLLPGSVDEELVLTLPEDGRPRCLSNVCTHRGMLVVEGEGHVRSLRCRYHGRRFGIDGSFHSMPEFEQEWSNVQIGASADGQPAFDLPAGHPDTGHRIAAWYFWLFPNVMLNFYPWGLSLNVVQPVGPTRTRVLFRSYVSEASTLASGAGADLRRVEMEDEEIVEATQRGVRSRLYDRGRYSPRREQGTHHFHSLLSKQLADR